MLVTFLESLCRDTSVIDRLHVWYMSNTNYRHHRPSYGQPSAKLRARPSQTAGATLANYGRDPVKLRAPAGPRRRNASFSEFLARLMIAASFGFLKQKNTQKM